MEETVLWLNMTNGDRIPVAEVQFDGSDIRFKHVVLGGAMPSERWDLVAISAVQFITAGTV